MPLSDLRSGKWSSTWRRLLPSVWKSGWGPTVIQRAKGWQIGQAIQGSGP